MKLHDYQINHIEQVLKAFETCNTVMLQMPTGTGKTHVFCEISKRFWKIGRGRVLILAHRIELITQIKERMKSFGLPNSIGLIISGSEYTENNLIQIASVQTLNLRKDKIDFLKGISLIIIDEAHHTPSNTYVEILTQYLQKHTKLLGVTATPLRLDGKGFEAIFQKLICSNSFRWFIDNKFLCPIKHFASDLINMNDISLATDNEGFDDYDAKELEKYYLSQKIMADVIESYRRFGENKKMILFAVTIGHAEEIAKRFRNENYSALVVSSHDGEKERKEKIEKFKNNEIQILVNVDIFSEGFDCPDIEVVQIAKPTKSLVKYLQMAGRVTRISKGKSYGILLDNSCLWKDHGLVTSDRKWFLNGNVAEKRDFSNIVFSDGTYGEEAYRRRVSEHLNIKLVLISAYGLNSEVLFINKTLNQLRAEYNIGKDTFFSFIETLELNLHEHLQGDKRNLYNRKVSQQLNDLIDFEFCSNKSWKSLTL